MRIVTPGRIPSNMKPHIATCRCCKAEIEFMEREALYINNPLNYGEAYLLTCPQCGGIAIYSLDDEKKKKGKK